MVEIRSLLLPIALAWAMLALAGTSPLSATASPKAEAIPMDFSHITSRAKADALVQRGELTKILFYPKRFGGSTDRYNIGYVPAGTKVALDFAHDRISGLIALGSIDRMTVEPRYRGKSIVPSAIVYLCKSNDQRKGVIDITVDIW